MSGIRAASLNGIRHGKGKKAQLEKRVDETLYLTKKRGGGILKEEVWYKGDQVAKYSLAYINKAVCGVDNGRVLGYDNQHGTHHRHYMGQVEEIQFPGYEALVNWFQGELESLWRARHEEKR